MAKRANRLPISDLKELVEEAELRAQLVRHRAEAVEQQIRLGEAKSTLTKKQLET